jgi:hypothetical protein
MVVLSYAWYFPILIQRFSASSGGTWIPKITFEDVYLMLWRFSNVHILSIAFLILILYTLFFKWKLISIKSGNNFKVLLLLFSICYFSLFLISFKLPVFIDRYLLFTSVLFYLIVAISISTIGISVRTSIYISSILVIIMFATLEIKNGKKPKTKELVDFMA